MADMRNLYLATVLLLGCGNDKGDGNTNIDAGADAAPLDDASPMVDAADPPFVTYPAATLPDDAASATKWAKASAPQLFMLGFTPLVVAEATLSVGGETCPTKTVNGATTTYTGGCTEMDGTPWTGTATQTGQPMGSIEYVDFGTTGTSTCNATEYPSTFKYNGTIVPSTTVPGMSTIKVTAEITGPDETNACQPRTGTFAIDYAFTLRKGTHDADGDGDTDDTYWSGTGKYGTSFDGSVDAMTTEEKLEDELCGDEALAGVTQVSAGGHAYTITYDGATDCDAESTVHWAYDGTDRGELTGISCSTGGSPRSTLLVLVAVGFVVRRRRNRRAV
jgi:MYXO-CTERM domain-containing protein